jgi:hypothetical protein
MESDELIMFGQVRIAGKMAKNSMSLKKSDEKLDSNR